jgi:acetone carboxylase gamma subunit
MLGSYAENSYVHKCSCGTEFMAPKGALHCHACLYDRVADLQKKIKSASAVLNIVKLNPMHSRKTQVRRVLSAIESLKE